MPMTKIELKKLIKKLEKIRGRHTELVSIYVPSGYNIHEINTLVKQEGGTASNIKSKTTRKNVLSALAKIEQRLKHYKRTPENGVVFFSGNISEKEGMQDIELWEFEPPEPIKFRTYRCDQTFILEPLRDQIREKEIYGLITFDTNNAAIAFLRGKAILVKKTMDSLVPGKTGKGGQSAARYSRVRSGLLLSFMKQVGEFSTKLFSEEKDLKGIIIGGPGPLKERFLEEDFLSEALKKKILGVKDLGYSGEEGLTELVERSDDLLKEASVMKEKKLLKDFLEHLKKDDGLVSYGVFEVEKALNLGAVETLMVSEEFPMEHYIINCSCGLKLEKTMKKENLPKECPECGGKLDIEEADIFEQLEDKADQMGGNYEIISADTPEGAQFLQLGGIGAILRFRI